MNDDMQHPDSGMNTEEEVREWLSSSDNLERRAVKKKVYSS
jgi:hypothetical protein